jgi:Ca-activated chloride channel family protein
VGQTSEVAIRNVAMKANSYGRRIFAFGVGVDVNTPLLDRISEETRAVSTYVLPKEDVEVKVSKVFKRLSGPVLADASMNVIGADGNPALGVIHEVLPSKLPDLYEGDQLVLLGKYAGEPSVTFIVKGNYLGRERTFRFSFTFDKATTQNAFVPRLWASRKIGVLVEAIRQLGADSTARPATVDQKSDPRIKELVDEIVRISTEFGILTEYTAFLAREGTDLSNRPEVLAAALRNFDSRALRVRSGWGSVNQETNLGFQRGQSTLNRGNAYYDAQMNSVSSAAVQQVNGRTFYRRGNRWVDAELVGKGDDVKPDEVISIGSKEFLELADKLAKEGRAGSLSMQGEMMIEVEGRAVLAK